MRPRLVLERRDARLEPRRLAAHEGEQALDRLALAVDRDHAPAAAQQLGGVAAGARRRGRRRGPARRSGRARRASVCRGSSPARCRSSGPSGATSALEHAEPVAVRDLRERVVVVAARAQRVDETRQAVDPAELCRDRRAFEVGAERDRVDADPVGDVVDVPHDLARAACRRGCGRRSRRKPIAKLMPTTPPDAPIASSCSSVRLRVDALSACAFECVATSGASEGARRPRSPPR